MQGGEEIGQKGGGPRAPHRRAPESEAPDQLGEGTNPGMNQEGLECRGPGLWPRALVMV